MIGKLIDPARRATNEDGFTIFELVITFAIFSVLAGILFQVVMSLNQGTTAVRQSSNLNEEARLLLNRMARELREANLIVSVVNPDGSTYNPDADREITFEVDFNGNGTIEPDAADPERLTYRYEVDEERVLFQAAGQTLPILAASVESMKLGFFSRKYECDSNTDGKVTWEELDSTSSPCPPELGNSNGQLDDELIAVDSITVEVSMFDGEHRQIYRTNVDMRNRGV